jgi:hypothetical protein
LSTSLIATLTFAIGISATPAPGLNPGSIGSSVGRIATSIIGDR